MITQQGKNTWSIGVEGNLDDTQNGVKEIFQDTEIINKMKESGCKFSSANSINWGRLAPQIVYYFSAYADMIKNGKIKGGAGVIRTHDLRVSPNHCFLTVFYVSTYQCSNGSSPIDPVG